MKILEVLKMKKGSSIVVVKDIKIGDIDTMAFRVLKLLYDKMYDKTYGDVESVLIEALQWHKTFNTIVSKKPGE
jgi:hypothetical protein